MYVIKEENSSWFPISSFRTPNQHSQDLKVVFKSPEVKSNHHYHAMKNTALCHGDLPPIDIAAIVTQKLWK